MTTPAQDSEAAIGKDASPHDLLMAACDRNVPLELHRHLDDGDLITARGRMLRFEDGRLYIEKPKSYGNHLNAAVEELYDVYFQIAGELFSFRTKVVFTHCIEELNDKKQVTAIALEPIAEVGMGQRRESFRTSLVSAGSMEAELHKASLTHYGAAPTNGSLFTAQIVNGSQGGLGIIVEREDAGKFGVLHRMFIEFTIPGDGESCMFLVEVRHIREIQEGMASRIGLRCVAWPDRLSHNRAIQRLNRYLTKVERTTARSKRAG